MRVASLVVAAGLVSAGAVISTPAAQAAPSCSLVVQSRASISAPYRGIPLRLGADCAAAGVVDAAWYAYHPTQGLVAVALFENGVRTDTWDMYDFTPLDRLTWRPQGAFDAASNQIPQTAAYTDVKVGSWAGLTATRSGVRVTLTSSAARYSAAGRRYIPWAGSVGQMQWKVPGTTTWRPLKNVRSNASGKYTFVYNVSAQRDYRVYFPATSVIWNAWSTTIRK